MRPKLRLPRPRFIAATECFADKNSDSDSDRDQDRDGDRAGEQRSAEQRPPSKFTKQRLPSFIIHPNGMVLHVFKKQRSMIEKTKTSGPKFICHPNGMILKVLNQKLCS